MNAELLLEIGTEELPARFVAPALEALRDRVVALLDEGRIAHGAARTLGTPRRLALIVEGVAAEGSAESTVAIGPAASVAFDTHGQPTKAAEGFARKQGVPVAALTRVRTDKGEYAAAEVTREGARTAELLAAALPARILAIPFPKSMRWGEPEISFGRPIRWIVALLGRGEIRFRVGPVESGSATRGHRVHGTGGAVAVDGVDAYLAALAASGVIADPAERRDAIERGVRELAASVGGRPVPDPGLLDEVTNLVESVTPVLGGFEREFLAVPREVLLTAMRTHQRYFAVEDANGNLLPHFVTISNTRVRDLGVVRHGNEAVLRARLADARYFYDLDLRKPLAERVDALAGVTYHKKLGSVRDKVERVRTLAATLAHEVGLASQLAAIDRTALLCKADLVTEMVGEFPEVQGTMGGYYALASGEPPVVAAAIREHYLPRFAGDALPAGDVGALVGLADRLDTLAGSFAVGEVPTGAADPFGLRRRALAIIQIVIARGWRLDVGRAIDSALGSVAAALKRPRAEVADELVRFLVARHATLLQAEGIGADVLDAAVQGGQAVDFLDAARRARALEAWKDYPEAIDLYRAAKRIANIRKDEPRGFDERPELLTEAAERALLDAVARLEPEVRALTSETRYAEALEQLRALSAPVTQFFDKILVMAENPELRHARFALLDTVAALIRSVGDLTKIQIEG
ncbi:MAG: glycine--tRNA ligase subunit beta [bacterium]